MKMQGNIYRLLLLSGTILLAARLADAAPSSSAEPPAVLFRGPLDRVTGLSPFQPGCNGAPQTGTNYPGAEVEPYLAINPAFPLNQFGVWQQDRWSNGGANGLSGAYSFDGGQTWRRSQPTFSRCAGGNALNGGDYERASDPWVSFGPTGIAYQISLSFDDSNPTNAILVSRSTNGGVSWSNPITLIRDTTDINQNDKESITADPTDARYAYAVWDRFRIDDQDNFFGPALFSRTSDAGLTWETPHEILNPGPNTQTIGNQIVVLPDGTLINLATTIDLVTGDQALVVQRSTDKGTTFSDPIRINSLINAPPVAGTGESVFDPETGEPVRTGNVIADIAVDRRDGRTLYVVAQDARFSGGEIDGVVLYRSDDAGLTWSPPVQVNRVPSVQAFIPNVRVAPDGTLAVTYYDFRKNTADPTTLPTQHFLALSNDRGEHFREIALDRPFNIRNAPVARGFFIGDYQGLQPVGASLFRPFFVIANMNVSTNRTDVYTNIAGGIFLSDRYQANRKLLALAIHRPAAATALLAKATTPTERKRTMH